AAECDLVEEQFRKYYRSEVSTVLDLGCGTGNHAIPLSKRGYHVTGVDRSPEMLEQARQKAVTATSPDNLILHSADIPNLHLHTTFDAVLIMFAVLGYQLGNEDVISTLATARRHLAPGGLLIFDVWYGPAVLLNRPSQRIKVANTDRGKIMRVSSG